MSRHIPGTIEAEGREFFYFEASDCEDFHKIIDDAFKNTPDLPMPTSGGVMEEKAWIRLDRDTSLLGISYKGDLLGWRAKLVAYCNVKHRKWGVVSRQKLTLCDGTELVLDKCDVTFDS